VDRTGKKIRGTQRKIYEKKGGETWETEEKGQAHKRVRRGAQGAREQMLIDEKQQTHKREGKEGELRCRRKKAEKENSREMRVGKDSNTCVADITGKQRLSAEDRKVRRPPQKLETRLMEHHTGKNHKEATWPEECSPNPENAIGKKILVKERGKKNGGSSGGKLLRTCTEENAVTSWDSGKKNRRGDDPVRGKR